MNFIIHKQKYSGGKRANGLLEVAANRLGTALGWGILTPKISPRKLKSGSHVVVNYGLTDLGDSSWLLELPSTEVLNHPNCVKVSSNKLKAFTVAQEWSADIPIVNFTTSKEEAERLIVEDKRRIVCRTLLTSTNGKGIVIADSPDELVDAPLYTEYFPKRWEIRVHVFAYPFCNKIICIQQKRKLTSDNLESRGIEERNRFIRNLDNGYIYSDNIDEEITEYPSLMIYITNSCIDFVRAIGLNFGAVDIVINKHFEYKILEVNSAPGLEGNRVELYKQCFEEFVEYYKS